MAGGVFVGRTANEDRVKSLDLSGYTVLAFAMHGPLRRQFQQTAQTNARPLIAESGPNTKGR